MCIEKAKTNAKTLKTRGTPPWTHTKAWRTKMEVGENGEEEVCGWWMEKRPNDEGLTPTKDGGTCLRRLSMFRKEVH